jgi:DNA gyrase subunit A
VIIGTKKGMSIRFDVSEIREVGRDSRGVWGIDLRDGDAVVSMDVIRDKDAQQVLAICENGYGKRTNVEEFRSQSRGGKGIIAIDASDRNGDVVDLDLVEESDSIVVITNRGQIIRTRVGEVRLAGRNTQGVRIIRLDDGEKVVGVEPMAEPDEAAVEALPAEAVEGSDAAEPEVTPTPAPTVDDSTPF